LIQLRAPFRCSLSSPCACVAVSKALLFRIILGLPFAAANWYSPFSEAISGKHSSGVPPVGGILIGAGIYWITGSWWWALLGIPADFGLLFLVLASPWLVREVYSRSRFSLIDELHAWHEGHRTILKIYRDSGVELTYSEGPTQYRINGSWVGTDDGYRITFPDNLVCRLAQNGGAFVVMVVERLCAEESGPDLEGLIFESHRKGK
jgi:hypothetical protein